MYLLPSSCTRRLDCVQIGQVSLCFCSFRKKPFSACTTDILCGLHGHTHIDAYNYAGGEENGLLNVTFDWFANSTFFFVLIDRENEQLDVWKISEDDSTPQYNNYQIPFNSTT